MYLVKDGRAEERNPSAVAAGVLKRMLEAEDPGKAPTTGSTRKTPPVSLKDNEMTPQPKRARTSAQDSSSISSISKADVSKEKPLSWKIKFTPCYGTSASSSTQLEHRSASITSGAAENQTNGPQSEWEDNDAQNVGGGEEGQRMKALLEEKRLYEEENQRLKERVFQLTAQTDRLRHSIPHRSFVDASTSSDDLQSNSMPRSASPETMNPIIISGADMLKTVGFGA
jgi:hypothetical protein